jgi:cyclic-di-GMP phosphodiesterase TipF (flagellum assembly factor)
MTIALETPASCTPSKTAPREVFVLSAMLVVALAAGIGFRLHVGLSPGLSATAGLLVYIAFIFGHLLIRRSSSTPAPGEVGVPAPDQARPRRAPLALGPGFDEAAPEARKQGPRNEKVREPQRASSRAEPSPGARSPQSTPVREPAGQMPSPGGPAADTKRTRRPGGAAALGRTPEKAATPGPVVAGPKLGPPDSRASTGKPMADDMDSVRAAIASAFSKSEPRPDAADLEPPIIASIEALRGMADRMRTAAARTMEPTAAPAGETAVSAATIEPSLTPPPVGPSHLRLGEIAAAITAQHYDILLEPILGLADRRAHHYEVSLRLHTASCGTQSAEDYTSVARSTGTLPLIDAVKIASGALVASRIADSGSSGSLFSQISGESLDSDRFLGEIAGIHFRDQSVSERLVLSFCQADIRGLPAAQRATLQEMADVGVRFAIEGVTDLDMDFADLEALGFSFVKLDASIFLEGLPTETGHIPAADICRHFARLGLTVIVGRIESDDQLARILGFGVLFGQGTLFGSPRSLKADVDRRSRSAAA